MKPQHFRRTPQRQPPATQVAIDFVAFGDRPGFVTDTLRQLLQVGGRDRLSRRRMCGQAAQLLLHVAQYAPEILAGHGLEQLEAATRAAATAVVVALSEPVVVLPGAEALLPVLAPAALVT